MDSVTKALDLATGTGIRKQRLTNGVERLDLTSYDRRLLEEGRDNLVRRVAKATGITGPQAWVEAVKLDAFAVIERALDGFPADLDKRRAAAMQLERVEAGKSPEAARQEVRLEMQFAQL